MNASAPGRFSDTQPPAPGFGNPLDHLKAKLDQVWQDSRPLSDTSADCPARRYLAGSGVDPAALADVRYHPALDYWQNVPGASPTSAGRFPALVAAYRLDHTAPWLRDTISEPEICKLVQVYLTPSGRLADLAKPVKHSPTLRTSQGAAVRLAAPAMLNGTLTLGLAVGIINAARTMAATGLPVWAIQEAGALAGFRWPRPLDRLLIYTDQARSTSAQILNNRATACGLEVQFLEPPRPGIR